MTLREHPEDSVVVLDKLTYAGNERNLDSVRDDPALPLREGGHRRPSSGRSAGGRVRRDRQLRRRVPRRPLSRGAGAVHPHRRLRHLRAAGGGALRRARALPPGQHRRGLRRGRRGPQPGGRPAPAAQPVQRQQGGRRDAGAGLPCLVRLARPSSPAVPTPTAGTSTRRRSSPSSSPTPSTTEPLPIYGDGEAVRDYIFVEDHCRGIDIALRQRDPRRGLQHRGRWRGQRHRGGRRRAPPPRQARLAQAVRRAIAPVTIAATPSTRRSSACLGWEPRVGFEEGMERTVRWYVEQPGVVAARSRAASSGTSTGGTTGRLAAGCP